MKQISLGEISLARFRSFIEPTTFTFGNDAGLKAIFGDNQIEPRLGGNGAGKSSFWDGVCFVLYGTSVKGLRASDLISYGHDNTILVLLLTVDGADHEIRRTAPPMRIWLDGKAVEQTDIDRLLGLTKPRFLASVIFGQAMPLFIDLPAPARGDLLDEVLGLEIWIKAAELAGKKHLALNRTLTELRRGIAHTEGQIKAVRDFGDFEDLIKTWVAQRKERLDAVLSRFEAAEQEYRRLEQEIHKGVQLVDEETSRVRHDSFTRQNRAAHARLAALNSERKRLYDDSQFLASHDNCPVCHQPITVEYSHDYGERTKPRLNEIEQQREVATVDIETTQAEVAAAEIDWQAVVRTNEGRLAAQQVLQTEIRAREREMRELEAEAERIDAEVNPYTAEAERALAEYRRLETSLNELRVQEQQRVTELTALDFWRSGFRRVRLYCLDQVLQELTIETRNSLLSLGLLGWSISFTTATETKAGTQRLGVQVEIAAPGAKSKFEVVSGGEGQRARLAASLGFAGLIQRWAGVRFDLEVFDEPTTWLSDAGVADLLDCLAERAERSGKTVWICDHRALTHGAFRAALIVRKDDRGSHIAAA